MLTAVLPFQWVWEMSDFLYLLEAPLSLGPDE